MRRLARLAGVVGGTLLVAALLMLSCRPTGPSVVVYTSVDQVYSEPVFREFERATGIHVRAVYDVEAAKTTGLVQRLLSEKGRPRADVFWSGEVVQTLSLKEAGVLESYRSPSASDLPTSVVDPQGYWAGFGGRGRVFLVNTGRLRELPTDHPVSISDLATRMLPAGGTGMANPVFGTAATHAAVLYSTLGPGKAREFYRQIGDRGVQVLEGNATVRDKIASGQLVIGLLDTDDAQSAIRDGAQVRMVAPDQEPGRSGMLVVPNTAALVKGGPDAQSGKRFLDYLLSRDTEARLARAGWVQVPSRDLGAAGATPGILVGAKTMAVDWQAAYGMLSRSSADMRDLFVR